MENWTCARRVSSILFSGTGFFPLILVSVCLMACSVDPNASLDGKAQKIATGMTMAQVTYLLGTPDTTTTESLIQINFGPNEGRTITNPNIAYMYYGEIDYQVCVVFDKKGTVVFVTRGGT